MPTATSRPHLCPCPHAYVHVNLSKNIQIWRISPLVTGEKGQGGQQTAFVYTGITCFSNCTLCHAAFPKRPTSVLALLTKSKDAFAFMEKAKSKKHSACVRQWADAKAAGAERPAPSPGTPGTPHFASRHPASRAACCL